MQEDVLTVVLHHATTIQPQAIYDAKYVHLVLSTQLLTANAQGDEATGASDSSATVYDNWTSGNRQGVRAPIAPIGETVEVRFLRLLFLAQQVHHLGVGPLFRLLTLETTRRWRPTQRGRRRAHDDGRGRGGGGERLRDAVDAAGIGSAVSTGLGLVDQM